jgi:dienelactone hydrolase
MASETIKYTADGLSMQGQLFRPAGGTGPRPAVLVYPEAFGLGKHALGKAEKIAALGYVALACDLHGDAKQLSSLEEVMPVLGPLASDCNKVRARAKGAYDALIAQSGVDKSKIAAIGYCFGGAMAIELGCSGANLAAIVGFHSGLSSINPDHLGAIKGRLLLCLGADDPGITPEQRATFEAGLRKGGVSWDMHLYGKVVHSFTNPDADSMNNPSFLKYDARANNESFGAMQRLFAETLGK